MTRKERVVDASQKSMPVASWPPPPKPSFWSSLTQKRTAFWLLLAMLAIPGLPLIVAIILPDGMELEEITNGPRVLETNDGILISFQPPDGWRGRGSPSGGSFHDGDRHIFIEIIDRDDHDPQTVGQRLMRRDAMSGIASAFDGGILDLPEMGLTGRSCTLILRDSVGRCALLEDDDVIMLVQTLGSQEEPALPLEDVLARLGRTGGN